MLFASDAGGGKRKAKMRRHPALLCSALMMHDVGRKMESKVVESDPFSVTLHWFHSTEREMKMNPFVTLMDLVLSTATTTVHL